MFQKKKLRFMPYLMAALFAWAGLSGIRVVIASPMLVGRTATDGVYLQFGSQCDCTYDELGWITWYKPEYAGFASWQLPRIDDDLSSGFLPYWALFAAGMGGVLILCAKRHRRQSRSSGFDFELLAAT